MKNTNNKKLFVIAVLVLSGFFNLSLFAQENKDELDAKLKEIKGNIEKVTLKVDGKDIVFEGKDAEKIGEKIKRFTKPHGMTWYSHLDDDSDMPTGETIIHKFKGDKSNWKIKHGDQKKVEVKIEDGKKIVTVTEMKDGKEETKTYEGDEAEKYLKENMEEGDVMMHHADGEGFMWEGKSGNHKKIEVKVEDGKKKVTVTEMKDGKEETKTYEGEEAEKFLAETEHSKEIRIHVNGEGDDNEMFFNKRIGEGCCCCCHKIKHMMDMPKHGDDVEKIIIEKTIKHEKKTDQKESK